MIFDLSFIAIIGIAYMLLLFGIAYIANHGWIPQTITKHPITYVLSLGIFASAWAFYGIVDLSYEFGYGALAYYLGTGAFFLFSPIIQAPLAELSHRFQLHSVADLLTFRYHSHWAGILATLCMLLAVLPLLTLQIQAVAETLRLITIAGEPETLRIGQWFNQRDTIALIYCLLMTAFCIIFGTNHKQHQGLITAMAFESLVKICALISVGLFSVYHVFGSFEALDQWLIDHPSHLVRLFNPSEVPASHTLLLVFIATGVLMPHIYQMNHMGLSIKRTARVVTWAFPLFLLLMALPVFPILWAGFKLEVPSVIEYFTLSVPMMAGSKTMTIVAFIGGLSAASGALIVSVLALSTMLLNHWVLPLLKLKTQEDLYAQLRWLRRFIIVVIALAGYSIYLLLNNRYSLVDLALTAFIQALQFLPGIVAINHWPRANRHGLMAGLTVGTALWGTGLVMPVITGHTLITMPFTHNPEIIGIDNWHTVTIISLIANMATFVVVSLLTTMNEEEQYSADLCAEDELSHPVRMILDVHTADEFKWRLAETLGEAAANKEVDRAIRYLQLMSNERRPYALRRLRKRIETNLSGLMGQAMASEIMDKHFPYKLPNSGGFTDINLIESRLDRFGHQLSGMAADVNQLRIHHRNTLQELPLAICSLGVDDEVLMWNGAMANLTGIPGGDITGSNLSSLPEPWGHLIRGFVNSQQNHTNKEIVSGHRHYWYRLHKSVVRGPMTQRIDGQVILIEDITENHALEQQLMHNARLASIGRLAAGVAHEIGNPVTGIACLAQNLRYESQEEERLQSAQQILSQTDRISRIVQSLVSFAHSGQASNEHKLHRVNAYNCTHEAIQLLSLQKDNQSVEFTNAIAQDLSLWGDSQRLIQVFINLLSNARDASPEGGSVTIAASDDGQHAFITVTDEGSGIDIEHLGQIMEPFFTTKEAGEGTGLGLSLVYSIIEEHNGNIEVKSPLNNGQGTCFTLKLPLSPDSINT